MTKPKAKKKPATKSRTKPKPKAKPKRKAKPTKPVASRTKQPSYAQAIRESKAREATQKPLFEKFQKCKSFDAVAALIAKNKPTYGTIPWIAWICAQGDRNWLANSEPGEKLQKQIFDTFVRLIRDGAELALVDAFGHNPDHALAQLLYFDQLTPEQRLQLLTYAIEHGVDPAERLVYPLWASEDGPFVGYHVTESALDVAMDDDEHAEFLEAIAEHVSREVIEDAYLRNTIANLGTWSESSKAWTNRGANGPLDRVVTKLRSNESAALVHFLCEAEVDAEYLERMIDGLDIDQPLPAPLTISVSTQWGLTPQVKIAAGSTPLDIVDAILGFVSRAEAANANSPQDNFRADDTAQIRRRAEAKRALLVARGAKKGAPAPLDLPPVLAETAEQILRLAKILGVDDAPIREAMAAIDTDGMGPWGFLRQLVPPFAEQLVAPLQSPALVQLLGAFTTDRWMNEFSNSDLPASKRAAADVAIAFHSEDDEHLLAVRSGGTTQIWKVSGDQVTVVAPTVPAYLAQAIDHWQSA